MMSFKHPNVVQAYDFITWTHFTKGAVGSRGSKESGNSKPVRVGMGVPFCLLHWDAKCDTIGVGSNPPCHARPGHLVARPIGWVHPFMVELSCW